jgi:hypothetical protein
METPNISVLENVQVVPWKLNLGCSDAHKGAGWTNVDIVPPCDVQADLTQRWPWADSSVDEIVAWDIFEHLPSKIHTMNEAHRVLKDKGKLEIVVPSTQGWGAFQDPTHVSFWTPNDFLYYCDQCAEWQRFHEPYKITARFKLAKLPDHDLYPMGVWKIKANLWAVKA